MKFNDAKILVFAKAPIPGQVKTRLINHLGKSGATKLHQKLVLKTLNTATQANLCPVELWCAPDSQHKFFTECSQRYSITLQTQRGADIGQRMAYAFAMTLHAKNQMSHGRYNKVLLIGCDCPDFTADYLLQALIQLEQGHDAVIGPALDGGYVLIGLQRYHPTIFQHIDWGTEKVTAQTYHRFEQLEYAWAELAKLRDIDRPQDLTIDI